VQRNVKFSAVIVLDNTEDGVVFISGICGLPMSKVVCQVELIAVKRNTVSYGGLAQLRFQNVEQRREIKRALMLVGCVEVRRYCCGFDPENNRLHGL
jgi:hypothetical protein